MGDPEAIVLRCGRARGWRYAELPPDIEARLPRWIEARDVAEGQVIKPGSVYRYRDWLVKLHGAGRSWRDMMRAGPAIRSARLHARLAPLRTPRPLLALEWRRGLQLAGGILVSEFIEGPRLFDVWGKDQRAIAAFSTFMVRMHEQRLLHGDFHPWNLIWNGTDWVLIDLDSMRHGLHTLRRRSIVETQWARVLRGLGFDDRLRASFESYLAEGEIGWPAEATWLRIVARARAMPPIPTC